MKLRSALKQTEINWPALHKPYRVNEELSGVKRGLPSAGWVVNRTDIKSVV